MQVAYRHRRFAIPPAIAAIFAACLSFAVWGADIRHAYYDGARDQLVVKIAYRGTVPNHDFTIHWGKCQREDGESYGVAARLIDLQGDDVAREDFVTRVRFSLAGLECRPAQLTLRLGRISHETLLIPDAPASRERRDRPRDMRKSAS